MSLSRQRRGAATRARYCAWCLSCILGSSLPAIAAERPSDFPGLRSMMSDAEYRAAGLDKLSGAERAALNRWLAVYAEFQFEEPSATTDADTGAPADTDELDPGHAATDQPAKERPREPGAAATPPVVPPPPPPDVITTRIVGEFRGWLGKTQFALENGQVWQQRSSGRYFHRATAPEVELLKNRFGFFVLRIKETGREVGVKRIR